MWLRDRSGFDHGPIDKDSPQARHVALPRDAEVDGSAVVDVWAVAPGGALRGGATRRVPLQERSGPREGDEAKEESLEERSRLVNFRCDCLLHLDSRLTPHPLFRFMHHATENYLLLQS